MSKVVLVTGSNSGIGFELVRLLAQRGHKVYLSARNEPAGIEAAEKLRKENLDVTSVHLDVTNIETIKAAKDIIEKSEGKLDVLVNNAGISGSGKETGASAADVSAIRDCLEVNLIGQIQTTTILLPLLRASKQAVILNVSSELGSNSWQASITPRGAQFVGYSASKAALNSYTIALAHELKKDGIKVNAATPGFTSSKLTNFNAWGKTARQGAESLLPWALLDKDGPTCQFLDSTGGKMAW